MGNITSFKPGQSGNPNGRPALPPEIRKARKKCQTVLIMKINEWFAEPDETFQRKLEDKKLNQLEKCIGNLILKAREDINTFKQLITIMAGVIPASDDDGYTELEIRVLNRTRELFEEQQRLAEPRSDQH